MARLVISDELLRRIVRQGAPCQTCDDAVCRIIDLFEGDGFLVPTGGQDGRLIHEILKIGAAESSSALSHVRQRDLLSQFLVLDVHFENLLTSLDIGQAHLDTPIKAARTQQRVIQDIRAVRGSNDNDPRVALEAIHLGQDLIECLFALVIAATHSCTALTTDGVNLINEDDARRLLLGLLEDVAYTRGTDTDEELDELRCR
mmetsp:Transcript_55823/g.145606  ORF Transcript_55823/g.145606 Transcript_55823/m.145606 type:complete len:202 (+) Transcript_55823:761-1366(+)